MKKFYHLLGMGGTGMSALAHILHERGEIVSGHDLKETPRLNAVGIRSTSEIPHRSTVVYSSAITNDHPHLVSARQRGLPIMHRADLLKRLMDERHALLVTGTHGKTSTSALLSWVLQSAGLDPTYAIGGIVKNLKKNGGLGAGPYFVAEADESDGSFLNYFGKGAIVTNVERDHLDYWKTEANIIEGFKQFIAQVKEPKFLFYCHDDPILRGMSPPGISYGRSGHLCLKRYEQDGTKMHLALSFRGSTYHRVEISLIGEKNALNALAVFGMALQLGIDEAKIRTAFLSYKGVERRLERIGEVESIIFYDDYAHHPTEVCMTLSALKQSYRGRRLMVVFQPHRYTRIQTLDFSHSFDVADLVIITDVYSGGEVPIKGVDGLSFKKSLQGDNAIYFNRKNLFEIFPKMLIPGDLVVFIGAGDICEIGRKLMRMV